MPSGRTHDRITLWSAPVGAALVWLATWDSTKTLIFVGGYLLGGLFLSPDLDIHSRPYLRWGPLRWIWLPYRRGMHHRSMLSHGPIVGTTVRLLYLSLWVGLVGAIVLVCWAQSVDPMAWQALAWKQGQSIWQGIQLDVRRYPAELLVTFVGLEVGAMSHVLSDWGVSAFKRSQHRSSRGSGGSHKRRH
jgi:uncharacterized metal-binding protein